MVDVICKKCGAIYTGNVIPSSMECICESTEFELRGSNLTEAKAEEAVA